MARTARTQKQNPPSNVRLVYHRRNPFDRIIFHAHDLYNGHYTVQALYMRILSPSVTLRLAFYERLRDISFIFRDYGLPPFPVSHATSKRGLFHVQDMDPETIKIIQTTYHADFDAFGYSSNPRKATLLVRAD